MKLKDDYRSIWNKRLLKYPSFYRKMIAYTLISSIIPIVIVGIASYALTSNAIKDNVSQDITQILSYASKTMDTELEAVQNNLVQMELSSFFTSDLNEMKRTNYSSFYTGVYQNLLAFMNGNSRVKDIALYTLDENYLISSTYGGIKIESAVEREKYGNLLDKNQQLDWKVGYSQGGKDYDSGITLTSTVPLHSKEPIGFIQVIIDNKAFESLTKQFLKYEHEQMYVLDNTGQLVFHLNGTEVPEGLHELITVTKKGEQEFIYQWQGREYLVTSTESPIQKMLFVDMIPTAELYSSARKIAGITIGIVLVVLTAGIALAMIGTRKVYSPIRNLLSLISDNQTADMGTDEFSYVNQRWKEINRKASQLENQLNEQFPLIRELFALRLMEGQFTHDRREYLLELLRRHSIPEKQCAVVFIIAYDHLSDVTKFQETDRDLILFIMKNMTTELLEQQQLEGLVINSFNDQVVVWLWTEHEEMDVWSDKLKPVIDRIREQITHFLKSPATIGLSRTTSHVEELPDLYREAQLAIHSRMINGGNQIIESKGLAISMMYRYPTEIENHLTDSLLVGDLSEAKRMLDAFSDKVQSAVHNPELIMMSYDQLLSTTLRVVYLMNINSEQLFGCTTSELNVNLRTHTTIHSINEWFMDRIFEPIILYVNSKKNQEYEQFIEKVTDYIKAHYHLDISLDQCAQICNLSPQYLSKLFKRTMDISFIEYVTQLRVAKAQELLETTDLLVNEIAEQVGYNPKNFIRVFKKQVGLPPGQYREMHRK
ncbi:helix-turn-helix domain-containing protein [Paenibacillus sp. FSL R10-2734]|uniref:helix-turn-helix domain-containing protein n=1 Tax=Paenibacillus sp. FSL R10-2734 TaxID=2954691 RepID=UPI0030D8E67D